MNVFEDTPPVLFEDLDPDRLFRWDQEEGIYVPFYIPPSDLHLSPRIRQTWRSASEEIVKHWDQCYFTPRSDVAKRWYFRSLFPDITFFSILLKTWLHNDLREYFAYKWFNNDTFDDMDIVTKFTF